MAASYPSFGRTFVIKTNGIEKTLLSMADLTGINRTAFINTKLAEHFGLKPIHKSIEGDRILSSEDEAQMQSLRVQYLLLSSKAGFNPATAATDDLITMIQSFQAEVERRTGNVGYHEVSA